MPLNSFDQGLFADAIRERPGLIGQQTTTIRFRSDPETGQPVLDQGHPVGEVAITGSQAEEPGPEISYGRGFPLVGEVKPPVAEK